MPNYYGSGTGVLNWRENQYDLVLKSGKQIGDKIDVVKTEPKLYAYSVTSLATSAAKGSGDNAFVYLPVTNGEAFVRGTIPVNEDRFTISGAIPDPEKQFIETMIDSLKSRFKWTNNLAISNASDGNKKIVFQFCRDWHINYIEINWLSIVKCIMQSACDNPYIC